MGYSETSDIIVWDNEVSISALRRSWELLREIFLLSHSEIVDGTFTISLNNDEIISVEIFHNDGYYSKSGVYLVGKRDDVSQARNYELRLTTVPDATPRGIPRAFVRIFAGLAKWILKDVDERQAILDNKQDGYRAWGLLFEDIASGSKPDCELLERVALYSDAKDLFGRIMSSSCFDCWTICSDDIRGSFEEETSISWVTNQLSRQSRRTVVTVVRHGIFRHMLCHSWRSSS